MSDEERTVKDPVCGMKLDERHIKESLIYKGRSYYFCSVGCRAEFVLVAFGFDPAPVFAAGNSEKIDINNWGGVVVDANQMTSVPGVFAGGDLVCGSRFSGAGRARQSQSRRWHSQLFVVAECAHNGRAEVSNPGKELQRAAESVHLPQSQLVPQLHSLLSFIGQFLPVFLQFGLSAANAAMQITAARTENRIFV